MFRVLSAHLLFTAGCVGAPSVVSQAPSTDAAEHARVVRTRLHNLMRTLPQHPMPSITRCNGLVAAIDSTNTEYPTLRDALENTPDATSVFVCPGVHLGPFARATIWNHSVIGLDGDPENTVLDAAGTDQLFDSRGWRGERMRFHALTFQGVYTPPSYPGNWESAFDAEDGLLDVSRCIFQDNQASSSPLDLVDMLGVRIVDSVFRHNSPWGGGGGGVDLGIGNATENQGTAQISRTLFFENVGGGSGGGALGISGSRPNGSVLIEDCEFIKNRSDGGAGGITVKSHTMEIDIINSSFRRNTATGSPDGGAISIHSNPIGRIDSLLIARLENNVFWNNRSPVYPAIAVSARDWWAPIELSIRGGIIAGNHGEPPLFDAGPAVSTGTGEFVKLSIQGVDFGVGRWVNSGYDVTGCNGELGPNAWVRSDDELGIVCERL